MNRFEINFSLNDVNMTIDTNVDEFASEEEKITAVKNAIVSRLLKFESYKEITDEEIDNLVDVTSISEIEKRKFRCTGFRRYELVKNVMAFTEDEAMEIADESFCDSYSDCDDEWLDYSEVENVEEVDLVA